MGKDYGEHLKLKSLVGNDIKHSFEESGKRYGMNEGLGKSGIKVRDISGGTHFCQFYRTQEDLMEILVPYFKAGLKNNELCIWTVSEPFKAKEEAVEKFRKVIPQLDVYLEKGQIEIIPCIDLHTEEGSFNRKKALNYWIKKANQALDNGYKV